jgi:tetratricopeptide (TPR) repeat protein
MHHAKIEIVRKAMLEIDKLDAEIRARVRAGDTAEAEAIVRGELKQGTENAKLYFLLALSTHARDARGAAAAIERSIALDGSSIDALLLQLRIAIQSGDRSRVVAASNAMVAAAPNSARMLAMAAKAQFKVRAYHEAARTWWRIEAISEQGVEPLINGLRALAKATTGIPGDANISRQIRQEMANAVDRLAGINTRAALEFLPWLSLDHIDVNVRLLIRATNAGVEFDPKLMIRILPELQRRAERNFEQGDLRAAGAAFSTILSLMPANRRARVRLRSCIAGIVSIGNKHFVERKFAAAAEAYQTALEFDGESAVIWRRFSICLEQVGSFLKAAGAWMRYGDLSKDPQARRRALDAAVKAEPSHRKLAILAEMRLSGPIDLRIVRQGDALASSLIRGLGMSLQESEVEPGIQVLKALEAWDRDHRGAKILRERLRRTLAAGLLRAQDEGNFAETFRLAQRLIFVDPAHVPALQALGRAYISRREPEKALEIYNTLVGLFPDEITFQSRAAACLAMMGNAGREIADVA